MRFTVRSEEPATREHMLPPPDGTLAAEVRNVSVPLGMGTWRPADPARGAGAHHPSRAAGAGVITPPMPAAQALNPRSTP
ncbi:hypothetical protein [Streptomyces flavofungini]|uniref:hypothetical protein n=1 Tax=Streptomyces flavofungini TaxID=68200 RepID=UPI0025B0277B|nr:hypothetical protein [Streptomyces flavofungini]WJV44776.1 hypothetical protein QUY26_04070 [Streptomyces flavofungini]